VKIRKTKFCTTFHILGSFQKPFVSPVLNPPFMAMGTRARQFCLLFSPFFQTGDAPDTGICHYCSSVPQGIVPSVCVCAKYGSVNYVIMCLGSCNDRIFIHQRSYV